MDRNRTLTRLAGLMAVLFAATLLSAGDAEARGKRKRRGAQINQKALGQLMGDFKFGMTKERVVKILAKGIYARYKEKIRETSDVYQQDKLRRERKKEVRRITKSYIEFEGKRTGWDVSIVDDQFAHKTGESMLVYWENVDGKDQRRFFFFHEGRLYKMFIALNLGKLSAEQRKFTFFKGVMEQRYGPGKVVKGDPPKLVWRTRKYLVQAVDKIEFYDNFCLVISDPGTEKTLAQLRESMKAPKDDNRVIDSVLAGEDDKGPSLDANKGAVDSILSD